MDPDAASCPVMFASSMGIRGYSIQLHHPAISVSHKIGGALILLFTVSRLHESTMQRNHSRFSNRQQIAARTYNLGFSKPLVLWQSFIFRVVDEVSWTR
ncbi:hypothetical protein Q31b_06570 [Novipirellula aureliae]|uniref:Uncharacterized protein n=1 Tax=Novipirellula aureliae TaxID=2527966 RepID=A0A5C6EAE2_9BACT|nr:hypothetical protein [Novipirellula aureliae]TWU45485.1 hypothetical protein Q31b_06570 [Novipirellula aureliae]